MGGGLEAVRLYISAIGPQVYGNGYIYNT